MTAIKPILLPILLGTFLFWTSNSFAQTDSRIPKVVPPSPNVAALQRYGDIAVSPYTGVPNISIPLYEIKSGDISVPISISYNASGIKVADEASRVGLGWVLKAGGAISRSIIGRDDWEDYHTQTFEIPMGPKYDQGSQFNYHYNCLSAINSYALPITTLNNTLTDFQPDQYSYNFNGYAGKFVLRRNKDVVLNKVEKIDIKVLDANATAWEIKTPDGFQYRFENIENYVENATDRKSSWYLSKITSPTGRIVQFLYTSITQNIQPAGSYFESKPIGFISGYCKTSSPPLPSHYSNSIPGRTYRSLYLSKIVFDQGEVQFNYSGGRVDVANDVQLDNIQIFSKKLGETVSTLVKKWNFTYSYFIGTHLNGGSTPTNPDLLYKRLKLVSLQESSSSTLLPPYVFSYNNDEDTNTELLPAKLSFARDHWGYFNGKFGNTSLIPSYAGGGGGQINPGAMGSERSTVPNYSQLFVLNKIQYPTGGFTKFEYESHDFDEPNSIINDHSFFATYTAAIPTSASLGFSNIQAGGTFTGTLNLTNMYPFAQDVTLEATFIKLSGLTPSTVNQITYSLKDPSGGEIGGGYVGSYLGSTIPPMTEYLGTLQSNSGVRMTLKKLLTPGIYTWIISIPSDAQLTASGVTIYYSKGEGFDPIVVNGDTIHNALYGGGLRIKRISDYTNASTMAKLRKYNYHYELNGKKYTYGRRMAKPNYSYYEFIMGGANGSSTCSSPCLIRESDSNIPLNGSTNGVVVGYDRVEELFGENGENGKAVYDYRNQPDIILDYRVDGMPLKPPYGGIIPDAGNGYLLKQVTYANNSGQFVKVNETINTYLDVSDFYSSVVYGIEKRPVSDQGVPGQECGMLSFYTYPSLAVNRWLLTSSVNKLHNNTGNLQPVVTTTEYAYDNGMHLQLTSKTEYKSGGNKVVTSYKYPADYPDAQCDDALLQMKGSAFMHALPVVKQTNIIKGTDQYVTASEINRYQVLNSKVLLKEIVNLETVKPISISSFAPLYDPSISSYPSGFKPRISFEHYDTKGNIIQWRKVSDMATSYIWEYSSLYPIAEVANASQSDIAYTSFEADGNGNWSGVNTQYIVTVASITGGKHYNQSGFSISKGGLNTVNTYNVSYWSKNTSSYLVNGASGTLIKTIGVWKLYVHEKVNATNGSIAVTGSGAIDELRLYPSSAQMTTFTYAPLVGMTAQSDSNGRITYFEYDGFGRLIYIRDEKSNIIKKYCYNYQGQSISCN